MIADVDESSARAILEHAKNSNGGVSASKSCGQIASGAPLTGKSSRNELAPPTQFPSESGHWYCPRTGKQIELPLRTQTRTALKRGYVPGVTSVTKVAHKEAIQRWMVNRAIKFTAGIMRESIEMGYPVPIDDDILASETWQLLNADSDATTGRGKALHAAIELCAQGRDWPGKWDEHIFNLQVELKSHGIYLRTGNTEHSFATSRYGGKIDWHNDEWLLDFKTKPRIEDGKKLAYPEHAQQLAAYHWGLVTKQQSSAHRRCANVFNGAEDAKVVFHEWSEKDLLKGWRKFEALLGVWWSDYES